MLECDQRWECLYLRGPDVGPHRLGAPGWGSRKWEPPAGRPSTGSLPCRFLFVASGFFGS